MKSKSAASTTDNPLQSITVLWLAKTENGWRRFPIDWKRFSIKDRQIEERDKYPDGRFQLRYYKDRRPIYVNAGTDLNKARNMIFDVRRDLKRPERLTLKMLAEEYLDEKINRGRKETAYQARLTLDELIPLCRNQYDRNGHHQTITRADVLRYHDHLRERDVSERTIANRHTHITIFLRWCNQHKGTQFDLNALKDVKPRIVQKLPTTFDKDTLNLMLEKAPAYTRVVIALGAFLGLREMEIAYARWEDYNVERKVYRVVAHRFKDEEFTPKDHAEREIAVSRQLAEILDQWKNSPRTKRIKSPYIVPTLHGKPNKNLLRHLKLFAKRIGLDSSEVSLHKLRRNALSSWLNDYGLSLSTVQQMAGHSPQSMAATLRYLRPQQLEDVQNKLDKLGG